MLASTSRVDAKSVAIDPGESWSRGYVSGHSLNARWFWTTMPSVKGLGQQ